MPKGDFNQYSTPENRFWYYVEPMMDDRGCWEWTGRKTPFGYGQLRISKRLTYAHRFSWELLNGPIPLGLKACHCCDNPSCVNPGHIFIGTQGDNMRDAAKKGRTNRVGLKGEDHGCAKITENQVRAIREMYKRGITTQLQVALHFGVSRELISYIIRREGWKHV